MTEQQLFLAIGIPSTLALIGSLVNVSYFVTIHGRIAGLETRLDARINALQAKINARIDRLIGKIYELDNRMTRLEERLKH
jgi:hypothetical protein